MSSKAAEKTTMTNAMLQLYIHNLVDVITAVI
jgi:hypothetical protein